MQEDFLRPINPEDEIPFICLYDKNCPNLCCIDPNQCMTPYDIIRLKNHFGMSSSSFLAKYTMQHIGPESGLPMVTLKPDDFEKKACPFLTDKGCGVYEDRPGSCRLYPLARGVSRSRETGEIREFYALIEEPHCRGINQKSGITVKEWIDRQKISKFNELNDLLMEIIGMKNVYMPGQADENFRRRFFMVCYDIDSFRANIRLKNILGDFALKVSPEMLKKAETDDEILLRIGLDWLKDTFFMQVNI